MLIIWIVNLKCRHTLWCLYFILLLLLKIMFFKARGSDTFYLEILNLFLRQYSLPLLLGLKLFKFSWLGGEIRTYLLKRHLLEIIIRWISILSYYLFLYLIILGHLVVDHLLLKHKLLLRLQLLFLSCGGYIVTWVCIV